MVNNDKFQRSLLFDQCHIPIGKFAGDFFFKTDIVDSVCHLRISRQDIVLQ